MHADRPHKPFHAAKPAALIIAALALCAGCTSTYTIESSLREPTFAIVGSGVMFDGKFIMPQQAPKILKAHKVPTDTVIYVRTDDFAGDMGSGHAGNKFNEGKAKIADSKRLKEAHAFMAVLWRAGYHKSVLVSEEKSSAWSTKP